jgi:methylglutaconyl-CoA hydratase
VSVDVVVRGQVRAITFARPKARNAFDGPLVEALTAAFVEAGQDQATRAVLLKSEGPVFSAGADLDWMRRMGAASAEENLTDARALALLMRTIDRCPKPTVVAVQGPALAGAVGLIAASDVAIASSGAEFGVGEVRLGLVPAVIGPYLVRAVGLRAARRLVLTGVRIPASEALRIGLIHDVVAPDELDAAVERTLASLAAGGPVALQRAKELLARLGSQADDALHEETARLIAELRATPEAREGVAAFFERRKPGWQP